MISLWQINFLILQIKETTCKEVRPVASAISNPIANYDPTSAEHTRGNVQDIGALTVEIPQNLDMAEKLG